MLNYLKISVLVVYCLQFTTCFTYSDVQFKGVEDYSVEQFSQKGIDVDLTAKIHNPNNYTITVAGSDLDLIINGKVVGKAKIDNNIRIKKKAEDLYKIGVKGTFNSGSLVSMLSILMSKSARVTLKGTVTAKTFMVRKTFPVEVTETIRF